MTTASDFEIVVCSANTTYLVWQAMLFHYSCVTYAGRTPVIVVHKDPHSDLLPGYQRIQDAGGIVQLAPDYQGYGGVNYPPRNTPAALRHVDTSASNIALCDADMIFLNGQPLEAWRSPVRQVTFDFVPYLNAEGPRHSEMLQAVCPKAGVDYQRLVDSPLSGGVPHCLPADLRHELADDWLAMIELFPTIDPYPTEVAGAPSRRLDCGPQKPWLTAMWALVLAIHRLGLATSMTYSCVSNLKGERLMETLEPPSPGMIHYCYDHEGFNKHHYHTDDAAERQVWQQPTGDGSISGVIRHQINDACKFYGFDGH
jgi:hypothetical protein